MSDVEATTRLKTAFARNNIPWAEHLSYLPQAKKLELAEYWDDRADDVARSGDGTPPDEPSDEDDDSPDHAPERHDLRDVPITALQTPKHIRKRLRRIAGLNGKPIKSARSDGQYHGPGRRDR